ncbi:hypothetical protein [Burkholderia vietnamiensis]|nr:hypothetical protein [Burkholderia vietnamiensis]
MPAADGCPLNLDLGLDLNLNLNLNLNRWPPTAEHGCRIPTADINSSAP